MELDDMLTRAGSHFAISRVFGEPIEHDGVTLIPVAVIMGGGGGGSDSRGSGGGFGGVVRGIGAYTVQDGKVGYKPAIDVFALGLVAVITAWTAARAVNRRSSKRAAKRASVHDHPADLASDLASAPAGAAVE